MPGRGALVPVVSRAVEGWAAVVSRFPCLRGRGPPREEPRLACIPITAFRLSPASTLRAAPHAIDRHSYRNAYADCSSSWWPHPAPAPAASLRPPSSRPAARHADLIGLEAAFRRVGQWPDQDTGRSAAALRTGPPWCRKPVLQPLAVFLPEQQTAARETAPAGTKAPRSCTLRFPTRLLTGSTSRCQLAGACHPWLWWTGGCPRHQR